MPAAIGHATHLYSSQRSCQYAADFVEVMSCTLRPNPSVGSRQTRMLGGTIALAGRARTEVCSNCDAPRDCIKAAKQDMLNKGYTWNLVAVLQVSDMTTSMDTPRPCSWSMIVDTAPWYLGRVQAHRWSGFNIGP